MSATRSPIPRGGEEDCIASSAPQRRNNSAVYSSKALRLKCAILEAENSQLQDEKNLLQNELRSLKANNSSDYQKIFSIISHDLRSPLASMADLTKFISENAEQFKPNELLRTVRNFETSFEHLYLLVDNILNWSLRELERTEPAPQVAELATIIEENIELVKLRSDRKCIEISNTARGPIDFFGDPQSVGIVIRNLLNNAIKFTRSDGSISVDCQTHEKFQCIEISDTGIGIPNKLLKNLFTTEALHSRAGTDNETGTGLGLPLCKSLIEENGGEIGVRSKPGIGSTFYFTLPRA